MDKPLDDRVALVTGAGGGIGAATAVLLARKGAKVILVDIARDGLDATVAQIEAEDGGFWSRQADVTDDKATRELFADIERRHDGLDIFVGSAALVGAPSFAPAISQGREHFERVLGVNLVSSFIYAQHSAKLMQKRGGGSVVTLSSVGGSAAQEHAISYCVSKAGLDQMTRSLAIEWAQYNIRVNAVAPGAVKTGHSDGGAARRATGATMQFIRKTPLGRHGTPEEIAEVVAFIVSDAASFVTGEVMRVDGGFLAY